MLNKPEIKPLTGLRFIAAACIAIAHFTEAPHWTLFGMSLNFAPIGMPLFFTLSGFVIHYVYAEGFAISWSRTAWDFSVARFSRIYPLFYFLFLYFCLFLPLGPLLQKDRLVLASYMSIPVPTGSWWYWTIDGTSLIEAQYGLSWSVSTEMFFYVVYAAVLYRIATIKSVRATITTLISVCVVAYALLWVINLTSDRWESMAIASHPGFISRQHDNANSFYRWLLYVSPYFHILEFAGGCLACQLCLNVARARVAVSSRTREILCWSGVAWITIAWWLMFYPQSASIVIPAPFLQFVNFLHLTFLMAPGCLLLIISFGLGTTKLGNVLSAPLPLFLGEISYSIYLGHQLTANFAYVPPSLQHPVVALGMAAVMIVVVATGLHYVIELPAKRLLRWALSGDEEHVSLSNRPTLAL